MGGDLIITGGMPLNGTVHIPAAKNSVLPLLAAALLCNGTVRFLQVPHLADVDTSVELLQGAGCTARWQGSDITVQGVPSTCRLAPEAAARMRASILFCAPLLARLGRVETVLPGGCRIGARPVDLHLSGLAQMGVHCREEGARLILTAPAGLHGADITLGFPSVGATETLLLAAAAAQGETVLRGAAREPEISDLAAFLNPFSASPHRITAEARQAVLYRARAPAPSGCRADECCIAAALRPWPTASWHPPLPVPARRQEAGWN